MLRLPEIRQREVSLVRSADIRLFLQVFIIPSNGLGRHAAGVGHTAVCPYARGVAGD